MVTCNVCGENKKVDKMQEGFYYVCKDCWFKVRIFIDGEEKDKDLFY